MMTIKMSGLPCFLAAGAISLAEIRRGFGPRVLCNAQNPLTCLALRTYAPVMLQCSKHRIVSVAKGSGATRLRARPSPGSALRWTSLDKKKVVRDMAKAVDRVGSTTAGETKPSEEDIKPALEAVTQGIDQTVVALKKTVDQAIATSETTQGRVKGNMEKVMKSAEEMVTFNKGNIEALIACSQIWAAGVQDLSKHIAATAQAQFESSVSAFRALTSVKSLKDAVDLQTSLARSSIEKAVSETGKITDASLKLAEQTYAPIGARLTLAVEKFGKSA